MISQLPAKQIADIRHGYGNYWTLDLDPLGMDRMDRVNFLTHTPGFPMVQTCVICRLIPIPVMLYLDTYCIFLYIV